MNNLAMIIQRRGARPGCAAVPVSSIDICSALLATCAGFCLGRGGSL